MHDRQGMKVAGLQAKGENVSVLASRESSESYVAYENRRKPEEEELRCISKYLISQDVFGPYLVQAADHDRKDKT